MPVESLPLMSLLFIVSLVILMKGADFLIEGSSAIAKYMGVSELVIGLTVVALGTSLPELVVSIRAAIDSKAELALANVLGSNITNILLVLGVTAAIKPVPAPSQLLKKDLPLGALLVGAFTAIALRPNGDEYLSNGTFPRWGGLVLIGFFLAFVLRLASDKKSGKNIEKEVSKPSLKEGFKASYLVVLGSTGLLIGGNYTVESAVNIARIIGLSETTIGLTIVALGTSLPELVASFAAAKKGYTGMAVGNIIGSNLMNLALVLGAAASIKTINISPNAKVDIITMTIVSLSMFTILKWRKSPQLSRPLGLLFLLGYFSYMTFVTLRVQN